MSSTPFRLRRHRRLLYDLGQPAVIMGTDGSWWVNPAAHELFASPEWRRRPTLEIPLVPSTDRDTSRATTMRAVLDDARWGLTVTDAAYDVDTRFFGRELTLAVSTHRLHSRRRQLLGMLALFRDDSARVRRERDLATAAEIDPLTGVANRRGLEGCVARIRARSSSFALLIVDIDHFKQTNDRLGHEAGDVVLMHVAQRILTTVGDRGGVVRLGGDEFLVASTIDSPTNARSLADLLLGRLTAPVLHRGDLIPISVSIGIVAVTATNTTTTSELLAAADRALYQAKRQGRSRVSMH